MAYSRSGQKPPRNKTHIKELLFDFNPTLARAVIYVLTGMLLASVFLNLAQVYLVVSSQSRVNTYIQTSQQNFITNQACAIALQRADAKLDMVDQWLGIAGNRGTLPGIGGEK